MFWFLAAGIGAFYAFWRTTAPTESEYQKALAEAQAESTPEEPEPADQPEDALRDYEEAPRVGYDTAAVEDVPRQPSPAYDPSTNPFKAATTENANGDGFPGSFDDIMPADAPLEDYVDAGNEEEEDAAGI